MVIGRREEVVAAGTEEGPRSQEEGGSSDHQQRSSGKVVRLECRWQGGGRVCQGPRRGRRWPPMESHNRRCDGAPGCDRKRWRAPLGMDPDQGPQVAPSLEEEEEEEAPPSRSEAGVVVLNPPTSRVGPTVDGKREGVDEGSSLSAPPMSPSWPITTLAPTPKFQRRCTDDKLSPIGSGGGGGDDTAESDLPSAG